MVNFFSWHVAIGDDGEEADEGDHVRDCFEGSHEQTLPKTRDRDVLLVSDQKNADNERQKAHR